MTETAPYFAEIADGPADAESVWLDADDGVRIRIGYWNRDAPNGTVLLFPGRSEYVEKYGRAAADLAARGFATVAIDWRGQGLAAKLSSNPHKGHVGKFSDYQRDVAATLAHVRAIGLPEPYYLLGHSMGGCIGLRALFNGLPVAAAGFTAPMWGIQFAPPLKPIAWTLSTVTRPLRLDGLFTPGQVSEPYVTRVDFEENHLTGDREMFDWLRAHLTAHPEMGLGGPSLRWLGEALTEMRDLARRPAPPVPCRTFLGGREAIVDPDAIRTRMAGWADGRLTEFPQCQHELMMETPEVRAQVFDDLAAHFTPRPPQSMAC